MGKSNIKGNGSLVEENYFKLVKVQTTDVRLIEGKMETEEEGEIAKQTCHPEAKNSLEAKTRSRRRRLYDRQTAPPATGEEERIGGIFLHKNFYFDTKPICTGVYSCRLQVSLTFHM